MIIQKECGNIAGQKLSRVISTPNCLELMVVKRDYFFKDLTLMLLVANLAITK